MNPASRLITAALVAATCTVLATTAGAHTRSQSFSSWQVSGTTLRATFSVSSIEVTRLAVGGGVASSLEDLLLGHLARNVTVRAQGLPCDSPAGPQTRPAREGFLRAEWLFECPAESPIEIGNDGFFAVAPSHVHYARVRKGDTPPVEHLFTDAQRRHVVTSDSTIPGESIGASFTAYVRLGIEHIMIGYDHIAFLLALLLLCRRLREVVFMVTGFTLGHSITLTLAVLGAVEPNAPVIEALIGFTIALVGAENVAARSGNGLPIALAGGLALLALAGLKIATGIGLPPLTLGGLALFTLCYVQLSDSQQTAARLRPTLTGLFGLIHGFAFASVLTEAGLPSDRLLPALFGFNVGVEIGQLGIVAALWLAGAALLRWRPETDRQLGLDTLSAALCGLGLFWLIERAFLIS